MSRRKMPIGLVVLLSLVVLYGCTNPLVTPTSLEEAQARRVTTRITLPGGAMYETGVLGPGALYEIWIPPAALWEAAGRSLALYAHGYVRPGQAVALPSDLNAFRDLLLSQGLAVAYSSFSQNGWAVKDGVIRTRQLLGYFKDSYGKPAKTYLVGASEGGIIALMLAQQNHELFDGLLSVCSLLGGAQMELAYVLNTRVLFDYFYREGLRQLAAFDPVAQALDTALGEGALAASGTGSGLPATAEAFVAAVFPVVLQVLAAAPPQSALAMATMTADGQPLFNWPPGMLEPPYPFLAELAATMATGFWYNLYGTADLLGRTHDHVMVDSTQAHYGSPVLSAEENLALNAGIERFAARPDALNYLEHWYQPSARLEIPVVTLHTTRDPVVPIQHEYAFRQIVGSDGAGSLAQFQAEGFGHCQLLTAAPPPAYFLPDPAFELQVTAAFNYLVAWSTSGEKPDPALFPLLSPLP